MLRPFYVPPSLLVEGIFCNRRLWLKAHHVEMFEEQQELARAKALKQHLSGRGLGLEGAAPAEEGWIFEARLPSGTRMDAWIPQDGLGIEFKSGNPHPTHLYQVWAIRQELNQLGVQQAELQLWYPAGYATEAGQMAEAYGLEHGWPDADGQLQVYAICADSDDPDFNIRLERNASVLMAELETGSIPDVKEPSAAICRRCSYQVFCYC